MPVQIKKAKELKPQMKIPPKVGTGRVELCFTVEGFFLLGELRKTIGGGCPFFVKKYCG
jgi:hypothetical protein